MPPPLTKRLLLAGGFGPAVFIAVLIAESLLRPGYDPLHHFGSELSNGPRGWLFIATFVFAGALTIAFACGLHQVLYGRGARFGPWLVGLFGCGLVVAGVFATDPKPGYPPGATAPAQSSWSSLIHDGNLVPTWIVLTAAILTLAAHFHSTGQRGWMWYSIAAATISLATLMIAAGLYNEDTRTGQYHGLWQRVSITVGFSWFAAVAVHFLQRTRS